MNDWSLVFPAPRNPHLLVTKKQVTCTDKMNFITNCYICLKSYLNIFKWVSTEMRGYYEFIVHSESYKLKI